MSCLVVSLKVEIVLNYEWPYYGLNMEDKMVRYFRAGLIVIVSLLVSQTRILDYLKDDTRAS